MALTCNMQWSAYIYLLLTIFTILFSPSLGYSSGNSLLSQLLSSSTSPVAISGLGRLDNSASASLLHSLPTSLATTPLLGRATTIPTGGATTTTHTTTTHTLPTTIAVHPNVLSKYSLYDYDDDYDDEDLLEDYEYYASSKQKKKSKNSYYKPASSYGNLLSFLPTTVTTLPATTTSTLLGGQTAGFGLLGGNSRIGGGLLGGLGVGNGLLPQTTTITTNTLQPRLALPQIATPNIQTLLLHPKQLKPSYYSKKKRKKKKAKKSKYYSKYDDYDTKKKYSSKQSYMPYKLSSKDIIKKLLLEDVLDPLALLDDGDDIGSLIAYKNMLRNRQKDMGIVPWWAAYRGNSLGDLRRMAASRAGIPPFFPQYDPFGMDFMHKPKPPFSMFPPPRLPPPPPSPLKMLPRPMLRFKNMPKAFPPARRRFSKPKSSSLGFVSLTQPFHRTKKPLMKRSFRPKPSPRKPIKKRTWRNIKPRKGGRRIKRKSNLTFRKRYLRKLH